jgi:hypothetical protein
MERTQVMVQSSSGGRSPTKVVEGDPVKKAAEAIIDRPPGVLRRAVPGEPTRCLPAEAIHKVEALAQRFEDASYGDSACLQVEGVPPATPLP